MIDSFGDFIEPALGFHGALDEICLGNVWEARDIHGFLHELEITLRLVFPHLVHLVCKDDGGDIDRWKRLSEEYFGIDEHDYPVMVQKARHLMYLFGMLMGAER